MTVGQRIAKNSAFILSSNILVKVISMAFIIYAARTLGPTEFGVYALIMTVVFIFSLFVDFGTSPMAIRELARNREAVDHLFNNILTLRIVLAIALYPLLIAAVNLLGYDERIKILIYISALGLLVGAFSGSFGIFYVSMERMKTPSVIRVVVSLTSSLCCIMVLYLGYGLMGVVLVSLAVALIGAVISGIWVRLFIIQYRFSFNMKEWINLLKYAAPFGILVMLFSLNRYIGIILLSSLKGPYPSIEAMGFYEPAQKTAISLMPVLESFKTASLPTLANNIRNNEIIKPILDKTTQISFLAVGIPLLIISIFFSYDLITFFFGDAYRDSSAAFQILGPAFALQSFNTPASTVLSATRDIYKFIPWIAATVALTVILCVVLIPLISFKGVAISVLAGNVFRAVVLQRLLKKALNIRSFEFRKYKKTVVLLFTMSCLCIALGLSDLQFLSKIVIVLVAYTGCIYIFFRPELVSFTSILKARQE